MCKATISSGKPRAPRVETTDAVLRDRVQLAPASSHHLPESTPGSPGLDPTMSSHKDLSVLSYKELQALAVKHQIPGNIKKLMLVKILRAVNIGNNSEVTRLLTDLKKNRKKRTKRVKTSQMDDALPLRMDSFDFTTRKDEYSPPIQQLYHPQQPHYPINWVGAEEEITNSSKHDVPKRNLTYEEIRQFVFYNRHNFYSNYDTNNNSAPTNEIVDLRTDATASQHLSAISNSYTNGNNSQQHLMHSSIHDSADEKMSLLLKKMLQAPVGANLNQIATPDPHWSLDAHNIRESSPDDSETMTAKSDINESDEVWNDDATTSQDLPALGFDNELTYGDDSFNRRTENSTSFYEPSLVNGLELNYNQRHSQYQFNMIPQADAQENCRSWLASSSLDNPITSTFNPKLNTLHQFQSLEDAEVINSGPCDSSVIQPNTRFPGNEQLYLSNISSLPDLQLDTSNYYRTAPGLQSPEPQNFYPQIYPSILDNSNFSRELNDSEQRGAYCQQKLASSIYRGELEQRPYHLNYYQEQQSLATARSIQTPVSVISNPLLGVQDEQIDENFAVAEVSSSVQSHPVSSHGPSLFGAYWPHWNSADRNSVVSTTGGRSLENTLNLCTPNYVDYSKLNETCSVYSNTAPVMTLRKSSNSVPTTLASGDCVQNSECQQPDFTSSSLLFSDESERNNCDQTDSIDLSTYCLGEHSDLAL